MFQRNTGKFKEFICCYDYDCEDAAEIKRLNRKFHRMIQYLQRK